MSPSLLLDNPLSTADLGVQNISQIIVWPEQVGDIPPQVVR